MRESLRVEDRVMVVRRLESWMVATFDVRLQSVDSQDKDVSEFFEGLDPLSIWLNCLNTSRWYVSRLPKSLINFPLNSCQSAMWQNVLCLFMGMFRRRSWILAESS